MVRKQFDCERDEGNIKEIVEMSCPMKYDTKENWKETTTSVGIYLNTKSCRDVKEN